MKDVYLGRSVAITGHTGFKGGWLSCWLKRLGAQVTGIALPPASDPSLFALLGLDQTIDSHFADIREPGPIAELLRRTAPEVVFHLAAQPLVRRPSRQTSLALCTSWRPAAPPHQYAPSSW